MPQTALFSARPLASMCLTRFLKISVAVYFAAACSGLLLAQTSASGQRSGGEPAAVPDRLTTKIDEGAVVTLHGTVHPLVRAAQNGITPLLRAESALAAKDKGAVADGMALDRMQVMLRRSDAQESALRQAIQEMHTPGGTSFHKWLTPDEFGRRFGPSDADVAKLEAWLQAKGFRVTGVNPGRQTIEIAGTVGRFRETFHTEIHAYEVNGETRYANAADPEIPAALAPVFGGFATLNNFRIRNYSRVLGKASYDAKTHRAKPQWTTDSYSQTNLLLAPGDFYNQYDLTKLYTAGTDGTGQSIAIINNANINVETVNRFRALFGLPVNPPQVIIDGNDPGIDGINDPFGSYPGSTTEEYLDVEWSGAVAPGATINLVTAADTAVAQGLFLAAQRAVSSNIAPVISLSVGECELGLGATNQYLSGLWEQAAAQGITVMVSTGDTGAAGCEDPNGYYAVSGQQVSGFASTPYNVAVGGTDFFYANGVSDLGTYWTLNPTDSSPVVSLTGQTPVPEQAWNDSQYGSNLRDFYANSQDTMTTMGSGGGGPSNCATGTVDANTGQYDSCSGGYAKPSWQTGFGPDQVRDLPDVSLFAADGLNFSYYPLCAADGDCITGGNTVQITGVGGTSASAPAFAGMMALVNQSYGRQGQANYVLYPLSKQYPAAFNDVVNGSNSVPCNYLGATYNGQPIAPDNCNYDANGLTVTDPVYGTATEGQIGDGGSTPYYSAVTGYDVATGLGSVDAYKMVTHWKDVALGGTTTTLTPSQTSITHGTAVRLTGAVIGANAGSVPTGQVALLTDSVEPGQQGQTNVVLDGTGAFSTSLGTLPGGTYNVWANYPGDSANAPSSSAKTQITVAAEPSVTTLTVDNALNISSLPVTVSARSNVPYGSPLILQAVPTPQSGMSGGTVPTGTVGFADNLIAIDTAVLSGVGDAEYNFTFPVGSHSLTASYSGDGSYQKSDTTATPFRFTVTRDTPAINLSITNTAYVTNRNEVLGSQPTTVTITVSNSVALVLGAASPTGTVTMSGAPAGSTTTATLVASSGASNVSSGPSQSAPAGVATFQIPAGTYGTENLTFTYQGTSGNGDTNYTTASASYSIPFIASDGTVDSATAATASATSTSPTAPVLVTVSVTGTGGVAPTGELYVVASGDRVVVDGELPSANGNSVVVSFTVDSSSLLQGTNQLTVQYMGDYRYKPSSTTLNVANPLSDFSLVPEMTILNVPATGAGAGTLTDAIHLSGYNGFSGTVSLACSGAGGVSCSLSPTSVALNSGVQAAATLTVNTSGVTRAGTYNLVVTGTDATANYVHTLGLQVQATPLATTPSFALSGTAVGITLPAMSGTSTITATPANGFTGMIALSCAVTASPAGATGTPTCSLAPTSVNVAGTAAVSSTMTVGVGASTTPGSYTVTVTGTSGTLTETAAVAVTVTAAAVPGSFSLAGTGVSIAAPGDSGSSAFMATPSNGFTGTIALTCAVTASPAGATGTPGCSLAPASVNITGTSAGSSTMTVTTGTATTAGSYTVTVTGKSGSILQTASVTVTIAPAAPAGSFALAGTDISISAPGGSGSSALTAEPSNGFTGTIALTCAVTVSPAGGTGTPGCSLVPASVSITGPSAGSSTLTMSTGTATTAGSYTVTVTGRSGSITQTTSVMVTLAPAAPASSFTLSAPAIPIGGPGESGMATVSATPANGFTGTIALTCALTASPAGATGLPTCSLAPASVSVTGTAAANSTVTVTTGANTTPGSYTLTVTGRSGGLTESVSTTVTIATPAAAASFTLAGGAIAISAPGGSGSSAVTITPNGGFTGDVALSCAVTQSPAGAVGIPACSLAPASVDVTGTAAVSSTLNVTTVSSTTAGAYTVTVTGSSGSLSKVATVAVTVSPAAPTGSFTLAVPAITVAAPGDSGSSVVTATAAGGFTGQIALTCAVTTAPPGASGAPACSVVPTAISINGSAAATATLMVETSSATTAGAYTVQVTGSSGGPSASVSVPVTVTAAALPGSFSLSAAPSTVTIGSPGGLGTSTISVTPANGFLGTVALTCALTSAPAGASELPACSLAPGSVTFAPDNLVPPSPLLTIRTTAETAWNEREVSPLFLRAGGGMALALLFLGIPLGWRGRRTAGAIKLLSVALACAMLAGAATGCGSGLHPTTGAPSGRTTAGSYTVTVTGTNGSESQSAVVTVIVE